MCFLYLHIFAAPIFRRIIKAWAVVIVLWTVSFIVSTMTRCGTHISESWDFTSKYCDTSPAEGWALVGSDVATEFITLILVIPTVSTGLMRTTKDARRASSAYSSLEVMTG